MHAQLEPTVVRPISNPDPDVKDSADFARDETLRALFAEVELANAMVELARISRDAETTKRNYVNARHSYDRAIQLLPSAAPYLTSAIESAITTKLAVVR